MLNEQLLANDLRDLVKDIFEVDSYASKMGDDRDIVVVSFTVVDRKPADDLVNFIERAYDFVLDADASPNIGQKGDFKVFVEIERNKRIAKQITEMLYGVSRLTNIKSFKFRYYKSFHSMPATIEELSQAIPQSTQEYDQRKADNALNNFSNFFGRSYLESIDVDDDTLEFRKKFSEPLRMKIRDFGGKQEVYNRTPGNIMIESADIAQVLYITKYVGNYNINKIGNYFIFENSNFALVLEKA